MWKSTHGFKHWNHSNTLWNKDLNGGGSSRILCGISKTYRYDVIWDMLWSFQKPIDLFGLGLGCRTSRMAHHVKVKAQARSFHWQHASRLAGGQAGADEGGAYGGEQRQRDGGGRRAGSQEGELPPLPQLKKQLLAGRSWGEVVVSDVANSNIFATKTYGQETANEHGRGWRHSWPHCFCGLV